MYFIYCCPYVGYFLNQKVKGRGKAISLWQSQRHRHADRATSIGFPGGRPGEGIADLALVYLCMAWFVQTNTYPNFLKMQ